MNLRVGGNSVSQTRSTSSTSPTGETSTSPNARGDSDSFANGSGPTALPLPSSSAAIPGQVDPKLAAEVTANRISGGRPAPVRYAQGPSLEQVANGAELKIGQKGASVAWLQEQLNAAGANPPLAVDGKLGPKTEAALKAYQQSRGAADAPGVFGAETRTAFDAENMMDPMTWKAVHADAVREGRTSLGRVDREVTDDDLRRTEAESFKPYQGTIQNGVVPMSQGDYRIPIGNSDKTIRQVGCMMTSFAMASTAITGNKSMNPAVANERIRDNGGFSGASLIPDRAAGALGMKVLGRVGTHNSSHAQMNSRLDAALAAGRPVVIGVDYKAGSRGTGNGTGVDHWVTITGKNPDGSYTAVDPAGGKPFTFRVGEGGGLVGSSPAAGHRYAAKEMIFLDRR